jgi:hypothetical protein
VKKNVFLNPEKAEKAENKTAAQSALRGFRGFRPLEKHFFSGNKESSARKPLGARTEGKSSGHNNNERILDMSETQSNAWREVAGEIEGNLLRSEEFLRLKQEWGGMSGAINEMILRRQRMVGQWLAGLSKERGRKVGKLSGDEFLRLAPVDVVCARIELSVLGG